MGDVRIGVIGGSGLYQMEALTGVRSEQVETPFGDPSDAITIGKLSGVEVAFLPRHGRGHRLNPTEIPVQANIYALKKLGVEWIISVNAVGSLREEIHPLDVVVPDQVFDRTVSRPRTFFGNGLVVHVSLADPFCNDLRGLLIETARSLGARTHAKGTYVCMEGPQFSTRAESNTYRLWGADVIGMTAIPEAKLAREAEICYATLAFSTDYDCWRENEEVVTADMIVQNLNKNVDMAKAILQKVVPLIPAERKCPCCNALKDAILTPKDKVPADAKKRLGLLLDKYLD